MQAQDGDRPANARHSTGGAPYRTETDPPVAPAELAGELVALRQLARGTAHDLGNVLGTVMLNLNLLEKRATDPATLRSVRSALLAVERGSALVARLLGAWPRECREAADDAASQPPSTPDDAGARGREPHTGGTVLVADDDPGLRAAAIDALTGLGCEVLHAESGPAALAILQSAQPLDLLLVDYTMAGMNGLEVVRRARAARPTLKVMVMTGHAGGPLRAGRNGIAAVLRKPFRAAEFTAQIRRVMGRGPRVGEGPP